MPKLGVVMVGMVAASAAVRAEGVRFEPDASPPGRWAALEGRHLKKVRQLTSPSMGLDKSGEAYFSPDGRRIIFQAYPRGQSEYQMFVMELDPVGRAIERTLKQVSPGGGPCTCGYFRPDGRRILFGSAHLGPTTQGASVYHRERSGYRWEMPPGMDIFETDLDGGNPKRLTTTAGYDAEAAYSRDGRRIVFTSCRDDGDPEIYVMDADGSHARRLTRSPGYDGGPFLSPDGQRIIFRADRRKDDLLQLYVINADGSGERQLTDTEYVNWGPYWHPNGRTIAFATSAHGHMNYEVYLMQVERGTVARVTYRDGFDGLPVFSNDGGRLMWTSKRGPDGTSQVFVADFTLPDGF